MIQLRLRERALLRQGQLSEPQASSGPAAMLLALRQGQNSPPAQTADPAAITPSPAAQVVITPPPQQPGPMPPSSG